MPQHGAHADRIAVVVGDAEVEHRATGGRGFDRVAEGRHMMTYGFDNHRRPVLAGQMTDPPAPGGRGFDRLADRRHLMTYGFDPPLRPVFAGQLTDPPVAGGPRIGVDAEL